MGKTFHPAFYPHSYLPEQPIVSIGPAWIDGVYSHGVWSYVANCAYNVVDQTVFANMQGILAALEFFQAGDAQFDYAVYIDDSCMYFMNKSISFPNDYLDEFNKREDLHLIFA